MLGGVPAGRSDQIGVTQRGAARPSQRLPNFQSMSEHDGTKLSGAKTHGRNNRSEVGMQSDDQHRLAARGAQGREDELRFVARVSRKLKFMGADAHRMQSLRVGETQKAIR